jgi:hypothetical protein
MAAGIVLLAGLVAWTNATGDKIAAPENVRLINLLTTVAMGAALAMIAVSEFLWRRMIRAAAPETLPAAVQSAFIIRLACREGAGLLGLTVAYLAALNGTLRAYPAYWVDAAPAALFVGFVALHWPTPEKLEAEARDARPVL